MFELRPAQKEILRYAGGKMGVSAVPGSGKTFTLACLAAELVADHLEDDQEVLVVTLVNSAVDNISARIDRLLRERGFIPRLGYRVRTLHGLAHDIVRERPGLISLAEDFQIIDEREATRVLEESRTAWLRAHPGCLDMYVDADIEDGKLNWVHRTALPELVQEVAHAFIRLAKDRQVQPEVLIARLAGREAELPLAAMCTRIYASYQQALAYRGAVDFDDLIRYALDALRADPEYLARLRQRWAYILEDEAQDSSALQEKILSTLAGEDGNWVRVGDPNQAIFETFTTASPEFLRAFIKRPDVVERHLSNSGRSCPDIIALANRLIDWVRNEHPEERVRGALDLPHIEPAPPGDSQANPPNSPEDIQIIERGFSADEEIRFVVESVAKWLPEHQNETVAALVPRNMRGFKLVEELRRRDIPCLELLQSTSATRQTAGVLGTILKHLADPTSPGKLAEAFRAWWRKDREETESAARLAFLAKMLRHCRGVEGYLWPRLDYDWLDAVAPEVESVADGRELLSGFRALVRRWHGAVLLPIDQLILTLAQDLFDEPADLALAHKLALLLRHTNDAHPEWGLVELSEELAVIARNQRKFLGMSEDDAAFDPDKYPGRVVVTTMHKAKGLEWDRVYLMSVNNYDFPSGQSYDTYIAEKSFIRDRLNLEAECLSQLETAVTGRPYEEGRATAQARLDYISERLRLLYVAITRARKELIITWNRGMPNAKKPAQGAIPLSALQAFRKKQLAVAAEGKTEP